jgi:hypothetical protein
VLRRLPEPGRRHTHGTATARGAGDAKESGSATPIETTNGLQQLVGPHDPLHPFAVHRRNQFTGDESSDHPAAVRGVHFGDTSNHNAG